MINFVCNKQTFKTIRHAKSVFEDMRDKGKNVNWIYYCPKCRGYHITSWTKQQIKQRFT